MLDGGGYYRGSSVLLSGTPGSGKTSLGARFLEAGCERGERGMLFAFEESPAQIVRNMRSVGVELQRWVDEGLLADHRRSSGGVRVGDPSCADLPTRSSSSSQATS